MYTVVPYEEDSPTVPQSSGQQEPSQSPATSCCVTLGGYSLLLIMTIADSSCACPCFRAFHIHLKILEGLSLFPTSHFKHPKHGNAWLAQLVERTMLDLRVVCSSPILGVEVTLKKKKNL